MRIVVIANFPSSDLRTKLSRIGGFFTAVIEHGSLQKVQENTCKVACIVLFTCKAFVNCTHLQCFSGSYMPRQLFDSVRFTASKQFSGSCLRVQTCLSGCRKVVLVLCAKG